MEAVLVVIVAVVVIVLLVKAARSRPERLEVPEVKVTITYGGEPPRRERSASGAVPRKGPEDRYVRCPACGARVRVSRACQYCREDLRPVGGDTPSFDETFPVEVVGESYYQTALDEICGGRDGAGHEFEATADLILDDNNPHDDQAVRVEIQGRHVGHLSRAEARRFRTLPDRPARCRALIIGGWDRGEGNQGSYGVRLDYWRQSGSKESTEP